MHSRAPLESLRRIMKNKMSNVLDKVINLLTKYPSLRDSDERLAATIWNNQINTDEVTSRELLLQFALGKLHSYESISRCRRKVQEEKVELRGLKWDKRHKNQKKVKDEVKELEVLIND